ncbi:MAG: Maf family nucleotide pyrophosphatase [Alistipes sp.]|jgi:septum formation protein|nr:Maf family nucleotide pyrophosphatase [Alistipes sp.]
MLLKDKLNGHRLILASGSPRRRQILADAGVSFVPAEPYEVDEVWPAGMAAADVAIYLAGLKSDAYPRELAAGDILLTADTTVVVDDRVLGKPSGEAEAVEMLSALSGRAHRVITGVVLRTATGRQSFAAESAVWFRTLSPEEITYYVTNFKPFDKAGAYAIQEWIGHVGITRIEGSFYNVMGLPIQMIYSNLNIMIS